MRAKAGLPPPVETAICSSPRRARERVYNTVRPHQALDYLTPQQFLLRAHDQQKCHYSTG
ncbi:MAG: hypothetical protein HYS38_00545 [Acidobacteria bacterium]|nr:hypothetical protein [Acidobacteriota bacterium]